MKTKKDPFNVLESKFSEISAEKTEAIDFLVNRVQENTDLLQSIRPNEIHGSNPVERSLFYAIPRAEYAVKVVVASALGLVIGTAAATVLLPITTTVLCFEKGRGLINDVVKSLTPELKEWKIPDAELRRGAIRSSENSSSIFYKTQDTNESDRKVSTNLASINALATTQSAEYPEFRSDISKLENLKSNPFNKPDEIKKLESEIEIKKEQTRIKNLIAELEKYRDEEIKLIKGNLKKGDTLVVKGLQQGDVGDQAQVKTQEFKRASSIESALFKRSFSFSAFRNLAQDDDRKLRRAKSLPVLGAVDGSPTQSLFFSSKNRSREEVQGIQKAISKIDEGYKKEIDKLTQANRDLTTQLISLGKNIMEYKESIQKEKNVNDLKFLLNSDNSKTEDILKKYDEIIGDTPATNPRANSSQAMRGSPIFFRSNSNLGASADLSQNKNKSDLLGMLNYDEKNKLEGIINERMHMQRQQPLPRASSVGLSGSSAAMAAAIRLIGSEQARGGDDSIKKLAPSR